MSVHMLAVEKRAAVTRRATKDERWFGEPATVEVAAAGWYAVCSCGWQGNNPHPVTADAVAAAAYHKGRGPVEDARAAAIAALHAADNDGDRATAAAAYNEPGAKR